MPAIARSAVWALALWQAADRIEPVLLDLSAALEEGSAAAFLARVDKNRCPDYDRLESNIVALTAQFRVGSSVNVVEQTRDGQAIEAKLDWLLRLRPKGGGPASERRHQLRCRLERRGKAWKVTALAPASFFSAIVSP
jgi:hypothetical protein